MSILALGAAYWLYSLAVVPFVEPLAAAPPSTAVAAEPADHDDRLSRQVERLRPYFEADAWELSDPIVLDSPTFSLLLKNYNTLAERRVEIKPCTLVFFPDAGVTTGGRERVVIMRAPGGAVLDFDEECDLSRAKVGRLLGGRLVGEVSIRGNLSRGDDPHDPSGELEITARDVQLNQERIWTPHDVKFRLGESRGSGSDMQILLARPAAGGRGAQHSMPRGIEAFQLMRDVRLLVDLKGGSLVPGQTSPTPHPRLRGNQPPVEVRCQGPFRFDMIDYVATFEDQVDVVRMNPTGPSDQLNCELLALYFAREPKELPPAAAEDNGPIAAGRPLADSPSSQLGSRSPFTVTKIEARGNPVVLRAPSTDAEARGQHLEYDVRRSAVLVEGDEPVALRYGSQQIVAKLIRYIPGPDSRETEVLAHGEGHLSGALPSDPTRRLKASWTRQLSLRPHEGKQLVSVLGSARLDYADMGSMAAEEIWFWFLQPPTNPGLPARGNGAGAPSAPVGRVRPHSLLARGHVTIDAPQFGARVEQLEAWFQEAGGAAAMATVHGHQPGSSAPAATPGKAPSRYQLAGRVARLQIATHGERMSVRDVTIAGEVALVEEAAPGTAEQPLKVFGDELQLLSADLPETTLYIVGRPSRVEARGLGLSGTNIQLDKAANRMWIDGEGEMTLPISKGTTPQAPAGGESVAIAFENGMTFDGQNALFEGQVVARTSAQKLETARLSARLTDRIDFSHPRQPDRPRLDEIVCSGGVRMENRSQKEGRVTAIDRIETRDLTINQLSGDLRATGPGWASSIREQEAGQGIPALGPRRNAAEKDGAAGKMSFLKVRFQQGIVGNVHRREVAFVEDVRAIYGPVAGWDGQLEVVRAAELSPEQVLLTCDRLSATDLGPVVGNAPAREAAGLGAGRAVELQATGNARVDGQGFTAQGDRLTYAADKQLLVLEGAGQSDAHLWRQSPSGGAPSHAAARKILYWRATNRVEADGIRFLDLNQLGSLK